MKRSVFIIVCIALFTGGFFSGNQKAMAQSAREGRSVTVAVTSELSALAEKWVTEYSIANPGTIINIVPAEGSPAADLWICNGVQAGRVTGTEGWKMVVARDVIVAVMSADNPGSDAISATGISPEGLGMMLASGRVNPGSAGTAGARAMVTEAAAGPAARFTRTDQINATRLADGSMVTSILRSEPSAIIFCSLADVTAESGTTLAEGIRLIPIDINSNGISDYFERFYSDFNTFNRGVYIGKYPKELASAVFCATGSRLTTEESAGFIGWILADGQEYLAGSGLTALAGGEGSVRREMLSTDASLTASSTEGRAGAGIIIWVAAVIALVAATGYLFHRLTRAGVKQYVTADESQPRAFGPATLATPAGLLFDKSHTWAFMEKNGTITIGIDDFLQYVTGPISRVTMKKAGEKVRKGEAVATLIQRGRKLEVLSPVSGTIVTANESVTSNTSLLHNAPYGEGWLYGIEPENWVNESGLLTMATRYREHLREEFTRLRDFLASMAATGNLRYAQLVLQDGGEMTDGILDEFGPEVWEEFQTRFINRS